MTILDIVRVCVCVCARVCAFGAGCNTNILSVPIIGTDKMHPSVRCIQHVEQNDVNFTVQGDFVLTNHATRLLLVIRL